MQVQTAEDRINTFLEKKYRYSKSFATKQTYRLAVNKFLEFLKVRYNLDINEAIVQYETKTQDPIAVLDEFYTFLSKYRLKTGRIGYRNSTIITTLVATKEFLNSQNLHIYNEDLKQRFKLPKKERAFEAGLTKEILVRLLHNCSPKLQTVILMCCSGGMRTSELLQLKLSDIDFGTNPTTIHLRKETTKTRDTRFTHISAEATKSLKDYLRRNFDWTEDSKQDGYLFLKHCNVSTSPEQYYKSVKSAQCTLVESLEIVVKSVPELAMKNENGRNNIHLHALRSWFKTQVTNAHQSDFAEALMGHTSIKLAYYKQNVKDRLKTYLEVEDALTISDFTKVEATMEDLKAELASVRVELEKVKQAQEIGTKYIKKES